MTRTLLDPGVRKVMQYQFIHSQTFLTILSSLPSLSHSHIRAGFTMKHYRTCGGPPGQRVPPSFFLKFITLKCSYLLMGGAPYPRPPPLFKLQLSPGPGGGAPLARVPKVRH